MKSVEDEWVPSVVEEPFEVPKALPNRYVRVYYGNKWKAFPALVPHTDHWIRVRQAQVWQAIRNLGIPTSFVTLTFRDCEIPSCWIVEKFFSAQYNRFMTRLYRFLGFRPKYIRVLDYGALNGRVHYHLAFWGVPQFDATIWHKMWRIGYVDVQVPHAYTDLLAKYPDYPLLDRAGQEWFLHQDKHIEVCVARLVGYLIKYLTKMSSHYEERPRSIRLFQPSRGITKNAKYELKRSEFLYMRDWMREELGENTKSFFYGRKRWWVDDNDKTTNDLWDRMTNWKYMDTNPIEFHPKKYEWDIFGDDDQDPPGSPLMEGILEPWEIDYIKFLESQNVEDPEEYYATPVDDAYNWLSLNKTNGRKRCHMRVKSEYIVARYEEQKFK